MKTANLNFAKRNMASVLLAASAIMSITAATDVISAPLAVTAIINEETGYRPGCASQFGGTLTGVGISSLLGTVSLEGNDCITPVENHFSFEGTMTFTLASGDEIFADYHGLFTPTHHSSIFAFTDSFFDITGGTGNFLYASGGGKLRGIENIANGWGLIRASGKLTGFTRDGDGKERKKDKEDRDKDRDRDRDKDKDREDRKESDRSKKDKDGNVNRLAGTGPSDVTALAGGDSSLFPGSQAPGDNFYQDQNRQLAGINALPESGSLSLLGIGLAGLVLLRRRKRINYVT